MSNWYLGGQTPIAAGWVGPRAVYVDFTSSITRGWHFQLYAGRKLIGVTSTTTARRVVGQLVVSDAPAPLTLIRVRSSERTTDFGPQLPRLPWNRFVLVWSAADYPADAHHFRITAAREAGGAVDDTNELALVEYLGDIAYRHALPPLPTAGTWRYRISPRDDARPAGNAGTPTDVTIVAEVPPADFSLDDHGNRFTLTVDAGDLVASFTYPG